MTKEKTSDMIKIHRQKKMDGKKIIKIGATGNAVWAVCIICIAVAVAATIITISSAGTATLVTGPAAGVNLGFAATALGMPTAITATGIAIAGGGVNALNKYFAIIHIVFL